MRDAIASQGLKAAPALAGAYWTWVASVTVADIVGLVTICYVILQGVYLSWRWRVEAKRRECTAADEHCPTLCPLVCRRRRA